MPDMTIAEAARALGYSTDTVRRGIVKGIGPLGHLLRDAGHRRNDGQWLVSLTPAQIEQHRKPAGIVGQPMPAAITVAQASPDASVLELLHAQVEDRDRQIGQLRADLERERSGRESERERHRADLAGLLERHETERNRLLAMLGEAQAALTARNQSVLVQLWDRLFGGRT